MPHTPAHHEDSIRHEQAREGLRMASLGVRQTLRGDSIRLQAAKKPSKGHESFLKALEASGADIRLEKMSGEILTGKVKHSDKYTITLQVQNEPIGDGYTNRVIFKHDISEFSAVNQKADAPHSAARGAQ